MFYGPLLESFAKVKNGIVNCIMKEDICCSYPPYKTVHVQRDKVKNILWAFSSFSMQELINPVERKCFSMMISTELSEQINWSPACHYK